MIILIVLSFVNFLIGVLTLSIVIFRDWETKRSRTKSGKTKLIKWLKVLGMITLTVLTLILLDIVIAYYTHWNLLWYGFIIKY